MSNRTEKATSSTLQVTLANRFVGEIQVEGLKAQVTSLACNRAGNIVLLTMNGPQSTVSAIAAALHQGKNRKAAHFTALPREQWDGPEQLHSMGGLGSGWIASRVEPTTQLDVAIVAHAANIGYCCQNPLPQPREVEPLSEESTQQKPSLKPRLLIPPQRYLLANEGAEHPDWMTFTGLMRSFWLPFPPSFAPLIWNVGLRTPFELAEDESAQFDGEHSLIEPVECTLGIAAWQVIPAKQWYTLLESITHQARTLGL